MANWKGKWQVFFTSTGSIHGGQETTTITSLISLFHFGIIFVGLSYSENQEQLTADGIGGSPYSASTVAGPDGRSQPDQRDLLMAKRLGKRVASVAKALK
ncbi:hypothetical protein [Salipaludibacillus sp. LMS25]|jgi:NAD(P)H dehydrogenase (quinone)|uniref:hypothetical protein n=1 Tax=Salipaludibacillus sp. LMS25 TaxID=2924031 RepID=UPI0034E94F64